MEIVRIENELKKWFKKDFVDNKYALLHLKNLSYGNLMYYSGFWKLINETYNIHSFAKNCPKKHGLEDLASPIANIRCKIC